MRALFAPVIFVIHFTLQMSNLAFWAVLIISLGLVKLVVPLTIVRRPIARLMNGMMFSFGKLSVAFIKLFNPVRFHINTRGTLSRGDWYLIIANHLSYLDIILLIEFAAFTIPAPKFFLKKELIWLPFVGLGAWALDMPFMRRYSRAQIEHKPHLKGKDIETTKRYCEKFKDHPTTVINFVEGTRFTPAKKLIKKSPFKQLLPPKAGGIAFTLAAMGSMFTNILDVTLLYPNNTKHPMLSMLCGQMTDVIIDINVLEVPEELIGDYFNDDNFKLGFQQWLNALWVEKDDRIQTLIKGL